MYDLNIGLGSYCDISVARFLLDLYVATRMAPYPSGHGVHVAEQRCIPDVVPKDRVALGEMVKVADLSLIHI